MVQARRAVRGARGLLIAALAAAALAGCRPERAGTMPPSITPLAPSDAASASDPGDLLARLEQVHPANGETRISVGSVDANRYLAGGWSPPERWQLTSDREAWRWSIGPTSRVRFSLERVEPLTLSLRALPFQPPGGRLQIVRVWVNDQFLTSLALAPGPNDYEIALPAPALRPGPNAVRFSYLWTERPARVLENNADTRELAMAISEITIRSASGASIGDAPSLVQVAVPDGSEPYRGLLPPRSGRVAMLAWPPAGSALELGWLRLGTADDGPPPAFRVEVEWDAGRAPLLEGTAAVPNRVEHRRLALPPEIDGPVRIHLVAEAPPGDAPRLAWLEPRLVPPDPSGGNGPRSVAPLRAAPGTNLVLFVLDAAARDRFGVYGSQAHTSPHIDRIARESIVFDSAFAQASYTLASTASLFTSRLPAEHGVIEEGDRLGPELPTLAEALARSGYATAAFTGNPYVSSVMRTTRGFQHVDELFRSPRNGHVATASEFVAPVRSFFEEHKDRPFFAYVHLIQPHEPYDVAPVDFYRGRVVQDYRGPFDGSQEQMREVFRGLLHPGFEDAAHIRGLYEGNLAYADAVVGQIVESLGQLGLWDRTVVVITADHGESLGERGVWGHGNSVHREQIRVPLIVRLPPGMTPPHRRDDLVATIDVMPSLLRLLGAWEPPGMAGRDWFAPPEPHAWPRAFPVIAEGRSGTVSVIAPGWKYSYEQSTGAERLLALPEEEDGPNLRWERPVTFAWLAEEAARLTAPRPPAPGAPAAPEAAADVPDDVKDALRALGYVE